MQLDEIKKRAVQLQVNGKLLMESFNLEDRLVKVGKVKLSGSFSYGLMIKPDIDLHIHVEDVEKSFPEIVEIGKSLILTPGVIKLQLNHKGDYVTPGAGKPKGVYMGLTIFFKDELWNLDIWFIKEENEVPLKLKLDDLSDEQREIILWLKTEIFEQGRYYRDFAPVDIYKAVLLDGVKDVTGLEEWRKLNPKSV